MEETKLEEENLLKTKKNLKKKIKGILTNRDILCFQFDDQIVKDFMTPLDKLVYYEV